MGIVKPPFGQVMWILHLVCLMPNLCRRLPCTSSEVKILRNISFNFTTLAYILQHQSHHFPADDDLRGRLGAAAVSPFGDLKVLLVCNSIDILDGFNQGIKSTVTFNF